MDNFENDFFPELNYADYQNPNFYLLEEEIPYISEG
jgi:hypothetical protein